MAKQIQKIKFFDNPSKLETVLREKSKQQILALIGHSNYHSDFDIWAYELSEIFSSGEK